MALLICLTLPLSGCIGSGSISDVSAPAQQNSFPQLKGIDLTGEERTIPNGLEGEPILLLVAFEQEQQTQVNTWIDIAREIESTHPQFRYYEIPLIYEGSAPFRFWVNNGMRSGIQDPIARMRTITVYTDREKFFEITGMAKDTVYAVLIDSDGKIIWQTDGAASQDHKDALLTMLSKAPE